MRRMELAGELVVGRFFNGINSLQFASPRIVEELEKAETEHSIYWMNAADPASPAGLSIEGIIRNGHENASTVIRRVYSSRLCFRGAELLAVSNRGSKEIEIFISPDDHDIKKALAFLKTPRTRKVQPENKITIEKINGKTAAAGAYYAVLSELGFVKDRGRLILW
jgi:ATP-dependent Lhr-like helicase